MKIVFSVVRRMFATWCGAGHVGGPGTRGNWRYDGASQDDVWMWPFPPGVLGKSLLIGPSSPGRSSLRVRLSHFAGECFLRCRRALWARRSAAGQAAVGWPNVPAKDHALPIWAILIIFRDVFIECPYDKGISPFFFFSCDVSFTPILFFGISRRAEPKIDVTVILDFLFRKTWLNILVNFTRQRGKRRFSLQISWNLDKWCFFSTAPAWCY